MTVESRKRISFHIDRSLLARLDVLSGRDGISRARHIEIAVRAHLKKQGAAPNPKRRSVDIFS